MSVYLISDNNNNKQNKMKNKKKTILNNIYKNLEKTFCLFIIFSVAIFSLYILKVLYIIFTL